MSIGLNQLLLLMAVTFFYAGYNLFIKVSGALVPAAASTTILATIFLQIMALTVSLVFLFMLSFTGDQSFALSHGTYLWAGLAGICIGLAEIGYFYLFGGLSGFTPMAASVAIPTIVSGTIVISLIFSFVVLGEPVGVRQAVGSIFIVCGILLFFTGGS